MTELATDATALSPLGMFLGLMLFALMALVLETISPRIRERSMSNKPDLNDLSTRELLSYLNWTRKFNGWYSPWDNGQGYTTEEIKAVLATREHIPTSAAERKAARQAEAKRKRNR
jgi:hypothetical protein